MSELKEKIEQLIGFLDRFQLRALMLQEGSLRVEIRRDPISQSSSTSSAQTAPLQERHEGIVVPSPMSGIFYRRPSPNEPPFVEEGDPVFAGQVLGLIEAMKVFNEIESPLSGILQKFCLSEGEMAREGEPLCIISPQGEKP